MLSRVRRRLGAGIAFAAMLLAALAPTVSVALARADSSIPSLLDICTVADKRERGSAEPGDFSPIQKSVFAADHCPICLYGADQPVPSPTVSFSFHAMESGLLQPGAQALLFTSLLFSPALARGPPVLS